MPEPSPLSDHERTELVAYLDRELSGEAARRVEARLSRDAVYRAEAQTLRQVWDLLDHLPRAEPSPEFTHRTLSRAAPTGPAVAPRGAASRRWPRVAGWAAAVLLAGWAGFAGYAAVSRRDAAAEQDLVRDLRVIENKRLYELVEDLEFLRELDHPDLFGDERTGSS